MVGLPCNQFAGQEPGSAEEIEEFCSATYGVTFPMTEENCTFPRSSRVSAVLQQKNPPPSR